MEVRIEVSEQLAAEARNKGLSVEVYVEQLLAKRASPASPANVSTSVVAAIDNLIELRKSNKLEGLTTKDLISEGRKY